MVFGKPISESEALPTGEVHPVAVKPWGPEEWHGQRTSSDMKRKAVTRRDFRANGEG